jgi:hypothetical protein
MNYIIPASGLIPLLTSIFNFRLLTKEYRILCYYFMTSFIVNAITIVLSYQHIPNLLFFHLYTPIEAILLLLFFRINAGSKLMGNALLFLMFAFPFYCIVNFIYFQNGAIFNTYTHSVESLLFMGLCIHYFWTQRAGQCGEEKWVTLPLNWVNSGLLFYFSSTFFLYTFSNILMTNYSTAINILIWNFQGAIVIATNLLIAFAFYQCRK